MVWQIIHDADFEGGKRPLSQRVPFVESQMLISDKLSEDEIASSFPPIQSKSIEYAASLQSPRCVKTHLPLNMLPKGLLDTCKVVYVARDPRDVCVSFYYHEQIRPELGFEGSFGEFVRFFKKGGVVYGDYWYHLEVI